MKINAQAFLKSSYALDLKINLNSSSLHTQQSPPAVCIIQWNILVNS